MRGPAYSFLTVVITALLFISNSSLAADISSIARTIRKEPQYESNAPKYCLAVFGPKAETRVWLVMDGDALFIDRNGNGDLTEADERVKGTLAPKPHREIAFNAGFVKAKDVPDETRIEVLEYPGLLYVNCHLKGMPWQRAVVDRAGYLEFASSREAAPILHFLGPLTVGIRFEHRFERSGPPKDFDIFVGSPGVGVGSFVRFGHEGIPPSLFPELEITFPSDNGSSVQAKTILQSRC